MDDGEPLQQERNGEDNGQIAADILQRPVGGNPGESGKAEGV